MMEISTATLDRPAEVKKGHHKWTKNVTKTEMMQRKIWIFFPHCFSESCPQDLEFGRFWDAVVSLSMRFSSSLGLKDTKKT